MKRKSVGIIVVVTIIAAIAGYNVYTSLNKEVRLSTYLANVEALANLEYDGGELPGVGITCSTGGSGDCYKVSYQEGLYGVCYFFCEATGASTDYCSSLYVNFVNFCTVIGGV